LSLLLLDDEEIFSDLLKILCKEIDVKFYSARNTKEAIKIVNNNKIELVIIDYNLKNEKGSIFNRYLKRYFHDIKTALSSGSFDNISEKVSNRFDYILDKGSLVAFVREFFGA
jgi:DNA-binding NtrC family response regulator